VDLTCSKTVGTDVKETIPGQLGPPEGFFKTKKCGFIKPLAGNTEFP